MPWRSSALALLVLGAVACSPSTPSGGAAPADGGSSPDGATQPPAIAFPAKWIDGTACGTDPDLQTFQITPDTFISASRCARRSRGRSCTSSSAARRRCSSTRAPAASM